MAALGRARRVLFPSARRGRSSAGTPAASRPYARNRSVCGLGVGTVRSTLTTRAPLLAVAVVLVCAPACRAADAPLPSSPAVDALLADARSAAPSASATTEHGGRRPPHQGCLRLRLRRRRPLRALRLATSATKGRRRRWRSPRTRRCAGPRIELRERLPRHPDGGAGPPSPTTRRTRFSPTSRTVSPTVPGSTTWLFVDSSRSAPGAREVDEDQVVDAGTVGETALDVGEHRVRRVVGDGMPQRHRLDVEEGAPAARSAVQGSPCLR